VSPDDSKDLARVMAEVRQARREARDLYQRQQLMIDLVAGAVWIAFGLYIVQGSLR